MKAAHRLSVKEVAVLLATEDTEARLLAHEALWSSRRSLWRRLTGWFW